MFKRDQAAVARWCKNEDKAVLVGLMVLLSIRMQWVGVGNQMRKVVAGDWTPLWGWKRDGYAYLLENKASLYRTIKDLRAGRISERAFLRQWLKVPGLGLPKAGFVMQLTCGRGGCLDMHNIERLGLDARVWQVPKRADIAAQMRVIDETIDRYLELCRTCGGCEVLWNEWCEHVATRVRTFEGADDVSRRHYDYLKEVKV